MGISTFGGRRSLNFYFRTTDYVGGGSLRMIKMIPRDKTGLKSTLCWYPQSQSEVSSNI